MEGLFGMLVFIGFLVYAVYRASGWNCGEHGGNVRATLRNGTFTIKGSGKMRDYNTDGVNADYDDYPRWCMYRNGKGINDLVNNLVIESGVTYIGKYSLQRFNVPSIIIPSTVISIGEKAFSGCSASSITISHGVVYIQKRAFENCKNLTSINIPDSVEYIERCAFIDCSSLASLSISNSVDFIDGYAFSGCSSLTSLRIPNSVTLLGEGAFLGCESLKSLTLGNGVETIEKKTFADSCNSLTSLSVPDSVKDIGDSAFSECKSLKTLTLGASVTNIGKKAFFGCVSLTSITALNPMPPIVTSETAFHGINVETCLLYVPKGSAYNTTKFWRGFKNIKIIE